MAILVGIDEAGYGPILGPLVVSAAVFRLPEQILTESLWETLRQSTAKTKQAAKGRIVINDSKKLHHGIGKYKTLQRGVLACLAATTDCPHPKNLAQLLKLLDTDIDDQIQQYPWYSLTLDQATITADNDDIKTASAALKRDMNNQQVHLQSIWSIPLLVEQFNHRTQLADNKATVLFSLASQLIDRTYRQFQNQNIQIVIDKQSGRSHYRELLQRLFPDLQMKILKETDHTSSYCLHSQNQTTMKIHFIAKGDHKQLPIALASMTSKYLRELFMELINAHFQKHCPNIKPTAGYYKDGKRFLNDIKTHNLQSHLAPTHLLIRQR